jgi:oligopeptide/dipeptide ABC transporter ATP-binding protein
LPDSAPPLLDVRQLRTVFRLGDGTEPAAVDDVSFTVGRGETVGLVGESGSGKSVTALSIVRLVAAPGRVSGGQILFDGMDLLAVDEATMRSTRGRRIGFVFQEPMTALDPVYTIGAQIEETLRVHGLAKRGRAHARVIELLDAVRMPDAARRAREYPHQLSGGLRQRAMIALALAAEPDLLIADEPTTALDVTIQAEILDLLRDLRRQFRLSVLLITHDLGVIAEMADRVIVMYAGRVAESGPVRRVLDSPAHPYTRALLASVPTGQAGLRPLAIAGQVPSIAGRPRGCAFEPRCPDRFAACAERPPLFDIDAEQRAACFLHASAIP